MRTQPCRTTLALLSSALLLGCATGRPRPGAAPPATPAPPATVPEAGSRQDAAGLDPSLLGQIPQGAVAALVIGRAPLTWLRQTALEDASLKAELEPYLVRRLGVDPTALDGVVAWLLIEDNVRPELALYLRLPAARAGNKDAGLAGTIVERHAGTPLVALTSDALPLTVLGQPIVAALTSDGLLVGTIGGVKAGLDRARGERPPLASAARLARMLKDGSWADLGAAVDVASVPGLGAAAATLGIETGALWLSMQHLRVEISGPPGPLGALKQKADEQLRKVVDLAAAEKGRALKRDDILAGALAIVAHHNLDRLVRLATPQLLADHLFVDVRLPTQESSAAIVTAVAGVAAAIAIPSFLRYQARARTQEARLNLAALKDAVLAWHAAHARGRAWRFPPSTGWTPSTPCCAVPGAPCRPQRGDFSRGTWAALGFDPGTDLRYQYRVLTGGAGASAHVTIEARGDLDCDGSFAVLRIRGRASADGTLRFEEPEVDEQQR